MADLAPAATPPALGALLGKALPRAAQRAAIERPSGQRPLPALHDSCPCHKGPDGYGSEAYHLRRYSERDVALEVDRALLALPHGLTDADREMCERNAREMFSRYLGLPVAYERCMWWQDKQAQIIAARKARIGKGQGDEFLGDDL